ncbi:type VI secretion system-associated protein TagF [Corallincola luteus]|uniref:Type VI secretion system-associated protein TagF n=2 Tax=Corallincola TaxID=1775176 RepID=A0A368NQ89_9GAMM|nr:MULTISPECIES: type VI secretion system-associated protein TagF [Corallincola]RCU52737.1 type VI secretion system-associated protein TagF [Corallincola holothuriorum]TCI03237.1 type VI secretion system-associated protein TagF [Corallincola luteus]
MSDTAVSGSFGYCGKLPARRDFVKDGLPEAFEQVWHEWIQSALAVSKEQLGDQWLSCYLTSPIWHFALSSGVCGDETLVGTMIPSVDAIGRHYPFTLVAGVEEAAIHYWKDRQWGDYTSEKALDVLDDDIDLKKWAKGLADEHPLSEVAIEPADLNAVANKGSGIVFSDSGLSSCPAILDQYLKEQHDAYCIWWTEGSELVQQCTLITSKLPLVSQFAAMLDGDWKAWGW